MSRWGLKDGIILRTYLPIGFYSLKHFVDIDARMVVRRSMVFSATRFRRVELEGYHGEREWLKPEEVRLLASIALAVPEGYGKVYQYPYPIGLRVEDSGADLNDEEVIDECEEALVDWLRKQNNELYLTVGPPPVLGGEEYSFNEAAVDIGKQEDVYNAIDVTDHLLIRGLGAILKAELLNQHHIFHVDACMSLYIAMDASLRLILRRLRETMENPSNRDAAAYLAEVYGDDRMPEKYFEPFYNDRIVAVHPDSRLGVFPDPPLAADDYYELYIQMCALYDFLVTGTIR